MRIQAVGRSVGAAPPRDEKCEVGARRLLAPPLPSSFRCFIERGRRFADRSAFLAKPRASVLRSLPRLEHFPPSSYIVLIVIPSYNKRDSVRLPVPFLHGFLGQSLAVNFAFTTDLVSSVSIDLASGIFLAQEEKAPAATRVRSIRPPESAGFSLGSPRTKNDFPKHPSSANGVERRVLRNSSRVSAPLLRICVKTRSFAAAAEGRGPAPRCGSFYMHTRIVAAARSSVSECPNDLVIRSRCDLAS